MAGAARRGQACRGDGEIGQLCSETIGRPARLREPGLNALPLALTTCIISGQVTRASVSLSVKTTPTSWDCRHSRCLIMAPFLLLFFLVGKEILWWWKSPWQAWHLGVPPHYLLCSTKTPQERLYLHPPHTGRLSSWNWL